jgi:hypothetical protein
MFVILSSTTPPPRSLFKTKAPCWMPALIVADATIVTRLARLISDPTHTLYHLRHHPLTCIVNPYVADGSAMAPRESMASTQHNNPQVPHTC